MILELLSRPLNVENRTIMQRTITILLGISIIFVINGVAQVASNGDFTLLQTAVRAGGQSSNGSFTVTGTAGQTIAGGFVQSQTKSVYAGFWTPAPLSPTAAGVTITGRVRTADGTGIRNAILTLTNAEGETRTAVSSAFGYYTFLDVPAGQTYILSVSTKRYAFGQPQIVIAVQDSLDDVDFVGEPIY